MHTHPQEYCCDCRGGMAQQARASTASVLDGGAGGSRSSSRVLSRMCARKNCTRTRRSRQVAVCANINCSREEATPTLTFGSLCFKCHCCLVPRQQCSVLGLPVVVLRPHQCNIVVLRVVAFQRQRQWQWQRPRPRQRQRQRERQRPRQRRGEGQIIKEGKKKEESC